MFARVTLSALFISMSIGCVTADQDDVSSTESEAKSTGATSGPTCSAGTDYMSDPMNCGTCGNVCGSGLCYSGTCPDSMAGHVFVIGNAYVTSNLALDRVLGNAVFMNERKPVRILAYAGTAPSAYITGADAAIQRQATARGRTFTTTKITSSADVAAKIGANDVFLVYAQPQQTSTFLNYLGDEWGVYLNQFTRNGGIVVVLDTASTNAGTADCLTRTGLMTLSSRIAVAGNAFVGKAEDATAARVPLMFAVSNAVAWAPSAYTNAVTNDAGQSIVVHRSIY